MKIYVASSWRCKHQPTVVKALRDVGHEVYDFRHPTETNHGFAWAEIDPEWESWSPEAYLQALKSPQAERGFNFDMNALHTCEACVLVLPCGRSAHLELGWAAGKGKRTYALILEPCEPELMYKMLDGIALSVPELISMLDEGVPLGTKKRCWLCGGSGKDPLFKTNVCPECRGLGDYSI